MKMNDFNWNECLNNPPRVFESVDHERMIKEAYWLRESFDNTFLYPMATKFHRSIVNMNWDEARDVFTTLKDVINQIKTNL